MNQYAFTLRGIARQLHPNLPPTPFWAYDDGSGLGGQAGSFGMAVVAESGTALDVSYTSALPFTYPDWIPVDTRLTPLGDQVRMMTHLHGGFVNADSDGNPAITPLGFGPGDTQMVHYSNQLPQMPASLLWFHDHGLGATRLNVFAGLAAAYILRDQYDIGTEPNPIGIPGGATKFRWSSRTANSAETESSFTRRAISRARFGSGSVSGMLCWSTARYGRTSTSSRACTVFGY
jgi:spore coat protein A, manganese oxidase